MRFRCADEPTLAHNTASSNRDLKRRKGKIQFTLATKNADILVKHLRLRPCLVYFRCPDGPITLYACLGVLPPFIDARSLALTPIDGRTPTLRRWCPILPRRVNLMTVFGKPIVLPKLEAPRPEDVDKWHATYIEVRSSGCISWILFRCSSEGVVISQLGSLLSIALLVLL